MNRTTLWMDARRAPLELARATRGLEIDPRYAASPHLVRLHAALQEHLRGRARETRAAAMLAELTIGVYRAASQRPEQPLDEGGGDAVPARDAWRQLAAAYALGLGALASLERRLPMRREEALRESWLCLQAAFDQIVRAQARLAEIEAKSGRDAGEDDFPSIVLQL